MGLREPTPFKWLKVSVADPEGFGGLIKLNLPLKIQPSIQKSWIHPWVFFTKVVKIKNKIGLQYCMQDLFIFCMKLFFTFVFICAWYTTTFL